MNVRSQYGRERGVSKQMVTSARNFSWTGWQKVQRFDCTATPTPGKTPGARPCFRLISPKASTRHRQPNTPAFREFARRRRKSPMLNLRNAILPQRYSVRIHAESSIIPTIICAICIRSGCSKCALEDGDDSSKLDHKRRCAPGCSGPYDLGDASRRPR